MGLFILFSIQYQEIVEIIKPQENIAGVGWCLKIENKQNTETGDIPLHGGNHPGTHFYLATNHQLVKVCQLNYNL